MQPQNLTTWPPQVSNWFVNARKRIWCASRTLNLKAKILNPTPLPFDSETQPSNPKPCTVNPQPSTPTLEHKTFTPRLVNLKPKLHTLKRKLRTPHIETRSPTPPGSKCFKKSTGKTRPARSCQVRTPTTSLNPQPCPPPSAYNSQPCPLPPPPPPTTFNPQPSTF